MRTPTESHSASEIPDQSWDEITARLRVLSNECEPEQPRLLLSEYSRLLDLYASSSSRFRSALDNVEQILAQQLGRVPGAQELQDFIGRMERGEPVLGKGTRRRRVSSGFDNFWAALSDDCQYAATMLAQVGLRVARIAEEVGIDSTPFLTMTYDPTPEHILGAQVAARRVTHRLQAVESTTRTELTRREQRVLADSAEVTNISATASRPFRSEDIIQVPAAPGDGPCVDAYIVHTSIAVSIREVRGWIGEQDLWDKLRALLKQRHYHVPDRSLYRWFLFNTLRRDERFVRRKTGRGLTDYEYRMDPDWPWQYSAELHVYIERRRAIGSDGFIAAEYARDLRDRVGLLLHEGCKAVIGQPQSDWSEWAQQGYRSIFATCQDLSWQPNQFHDQERGAFYGSFADIPAHHVGRLLTGLSLIAGPSLDRLRLANSEWLSAIDRATAWLQAVADRFFQVAYEKSFTTEQRELRCDELLAEWAGHRIRVADTCEQQGTGVIPTYISNVEASLKCFAMFARKSRDSNDDTDRDQLATRSLDLRDAWYELGRLRLNGSLGGPRFREAIKRIVRRPVKGNEKWRKARVRMLAIMDTGALPQTLRRVQTLLRGEGFKADTVRRAVHRSWRLKTHLNLKGDAEYDLLEELSPRLTKAFLYQPAACQEALRQSWRDGKKGNTISQLNELAKDPDVGRAGDVSLIENADQDARGDNWSE